MTFSTPAATPVRARRSLIPGLIRMSLVILACALLGVGRTLPGQRGIVIPLLLSLFACVLALFAQFVDASQRQRPRSPLRAFLSGALTLVPPCAIAAALLPPEFTGRPWVVGILFLCGAIALFAIDEALSSTFGQTHARPESGNSDSDADVLRLVIPSEQPADVSTSISGSSDISQRVQCLERLSEAGGDERITGSFRTGMKAGESLAVIHVPIVPPFCHPPDAECHVVDGADLRVRVTEIQPYGVRIELRRADASHAMDCRVRVTVTSNHDRGAA